MFEYIAAWSWKPMSGYRMINKVASSFQVGRRVQCLANCTVSPICDSYNYRPADNTCQLNTHDTPLIANSADIVADSDWSWWRPTFAEVVWTMHDDKWNPAFSVILHYTAQSENWIHYTHPLAVNVLSNSLSVHDLRCFKMYLNCTGFREDFGPSSTLTEFVL